MDWTNFENMDPHLLVGLVNTALRNHYGELEELCQAEDIDRDSLCQRLAVGDYHYNADTRQFR